MPQAADLKKGLRIELEDGPYTVLSVQSQSPTARGGATLIKFKARHLVTGRFRQLSHKSSDYIEDADVAYRNATYLYSDGALLHFMDEETYEQVALRPECLGDAQGFLLENMQVRLLYHNDVAISVELPDVVEARIVQTEPAVRGDTVNAVTKAATLESGAVIQVPMFINEGERVRVDTRDARYVGRA